MNDPKNQLPPGSKNKTREKTQILIGWLAASAAKNRGVLSPQTVEQCAYVMGIGDLERYGRVYENIWSRLDYACYQADLAPISLTLADQRQPRAHLGRVEWPASIEVLERIARSKTWQTQDFEQLLLLSESLPAQAHPLWQVASGGSLQSHA